MAMVLYELIKKGKMTLEDVKVKYPKWYDEVKKLIDEEGDK